MNYSQNEGTYIYKYPHPALTVDCVIFGFNGEQLNVLLIERGIEPYKGMWALPGGFIRMDETVEEAARRELREETGLKNVFLEQFRVFSEVRRDPRERVITVAFLALVRPSDFELMAGDDASAARWFDEQFLPPMAFDHTKIIQEARQYLKEALRTRPLAFRLLDKYFSMSELQRVYETIEGRTYDRRNFQRKAMQSGIVVREDDADIEMPISISGRESKTEESRRIETDQDMAFKASRQPQGKRNFFTLLSEKLREQKSERDEDDGSVKDLFNF